MPARVAQYLPRGSRAVVFSVPNPLEDAEGDHAAQGWKMWEVGGQILKGVRLFPSRIHARSPGARTLFGHPVAALLSPRFLAPIVML